MSAQRSASWEYAADFVRESPQVEQARARSEQLGYRSIAPDGGAMLRFLAAGTAARAVVEVGTGAGLSGAWLLSGMPQDGVLTTIDADSEGQRVARESFAAMGVAPQRTRIIAGDPAAVLPRLADGAYDLGHICAAAISADAGYAEEVLRLLRPGGTLVIDGMLGDDRVADPAARDPQTASLRELGKALREDERLMTALLPAGGGLLVAVKG